MLQIQHVFSRQNRDGDAPLLRSFFPANREFYREFCKFTPSGTLETANSHVNAGRYTQIPYSKEQGIISAEQGISPANTEFGKKVNHPRNKNALPQLANLSASHAITVCSATFLISEISL